MKPAIGRGLSLLLPGAFARWRTLASVAGDAPSPPPPDPVETFYVITDQDDYTVTESGDRITYD